MNVRSLTLVALVTFLALAVAACGQGLSSAGKTETPAPIDTQLGPDEPGAVVSWSEASSRVGQVITVEGPVVAGRRATAGKGPSTILVIGLGASDPGRFLAIIPDSLRAKFPEAPAQYFDGRLVRVTGKIVKYAGTPSITVTGRRKIKIVQ